MNPTYDFPGQVGLVTRASSGMGLAAARARSSTTRRSAASSACRSLDMDEAIANQPIARLGTADEMAAVVLWLCSPGASFVLGVALPVDGGYTAR